MVIIGAEGMQHNDWPENHWDNDDEDKEGPGCIGITFVYSVIMLAVIFTVIKVISIV